MVLDSHWFTTVEFVISAHDVRAGLFTSDELPRGMCRVPYDWRGDPELAHATAARGEAHGTWITAIDDPYLPLHYATVNLWTYLGRGLDRRWITMSNTAETGDTEDFLRAGRALGQAIAASDRRVLLLASGAMSHTFWPLRELRAHEASDPAHIRTEAAREADYRADRLAGGGPARQGDRHDARVPAGPAGSQVRALPDDGGGAGRGGADRAGPRVQRLRELGRHRADAHLVRPAARRLVRPGGRVAGMAEYRRILLDGAVVQVRRDGEELVTGDGRRVAAAGAVHLPPVTPTKIIAVHLNHQQPGGRVRRPAAARADLLPQAGLRAGRARRRGDPARPNCKYLNYEGEVAIVIGRTCRNVPRAEAGDYIAGYTIGNDFGLHDFRDTDAGSMLRVKGSDTMAPLGPGLVTGWDFHGKRLRTYVNGELAQDGSTDEMQWDMHYLVADIARTITLVPGDVLLSGTPANSRPVQPGDVVDVDGRRARHADQPRRHRAAGRDGGRRAADRERGGHLHRARAATGSSAASARPAGADMAAPRDVPDPERELDHDLGP